jgi:hypothetical protein
VARKKRGYKYTCQLTIEGFNHFLNEKKRIHEVELPEICQAIAEASSERKFILEQRKKAILKRLLFVNKCLNYSKIIKPNPVPIDLSGVPTCDLHAELAKREGVREIILSPEEEITMTSWEDACRFEVLPTVTGPARVLINED